MRRRSTANALANTDAARAGRRTHAGAVGPQRRKGEPRQQEADAHHPGDQPDPINGGLPEAHSCGRKQRRSPPARGWIRAAPATDERGPRAAERT